MDYFSFKTDKETFEKLKKAFVSYDKGTVGFFYKYKIDNDILTMTNCKFTFMEHQGPFYQFNKNSLIYKVYVDCRYNKYHSTNTEE